MLDEVPHENFDLSYGFGEYSPKTFSWDTRIYTAPPFHEEELDLPATGLDITTPNVAGRLSRDSEDGNDFNWSAGWSAAFLMFDGVEWDDCSRLVLSCVRKLLLPQMR